MTTISRVPRDSVEDPTQADSATAVRRHVIATQRDGTEGRYPNPADRILEIGSLVPAEDPRDLADDTVALIAATRMLEQLRFRRMDLDAYLATQQVVSSMFKLQRVIFEWPRSEDPIEPMPSALIQQTEEETIYAPEGMETQLLEDTFERYGERTVLRKLGIATVPLLITIWCAHKEERRAVRSTLVRAMMAEPSDQRYGRRIVVPEYYDRVVIFDLLGTAVDDDSDDAQQNHWVLAVRLSARVEIVQLVQPPPLMQPPTVNLRVGVDTEL